MPEREKCIGVENCPHYEGNRDKTDKCWYATKECLPFKKGRSLSTSPVTVCYHLKGPLKSKPAPIKENPPACITCDYLIAGDCRRDPSIKVCSTSYSLESYFCGQHQDFQAWNKLRLAGED